MSRLFRHGLAFTPIFRLMLPVVLLGGLFSPVWGGEAEVLELSKENWAEAASGGKEADAIYGDFVLRNDQIVCIVGRPVASRNANMTVRGVGGAIIDLSSRKFPNDQLSAFYPLAGKFRFTDVDSARVFVNNERQDELKGSGKNVSLVLRSVSGPAGLSATVRYNLFTQANAVHVVTTIKNETDKEIGFSLSDAMRADRTFSFASGDQLFTAHDEWFRQCYGIFAPEHKVTHKGGRLVAINYAPADGKKTIVPANGQVIFTRRIYPAGNTVRANGVAARMSGKEVKNTKVELVDANGPVANAKITVKAGGKTLGSMRTTRSGALQFPLAADNAELTIVAWGRPEATAAIDAGATIKVELETCGYLQAKIVGEDGKAIPCKVSITAKEGGTGVTPYYGPDSGASGVQNLRYTANGRFKCELAPGEYDLVISRGPEYDAVFTSVTIQQNETAPLEATLKRVIDTTGWVSTDYHSHSSPSGDNTGSQFGRVQNLLAEHVEFAPCTEHNRVSSYVPHLDRLKAHRWMATCTGLELTGQPLPINHQNAFPLVLKPHQQDNGAPLTDVNPVAQIERLAMWDNKSEKLVQVNHPNLVQMLGDRDLNGKFDGGFKGMLGFMDVVEVHPPIGIFNPPEAGGPVSKLPRNPMFHWLQMLNLGHRVVGVVNTDAHYNFHGSGWIRNYVKSSTDEPSEIDTMEMVQASKKGLVVMTTGPFMEVTAVSGDRLALPGQDLAGVNGEVALRVKVQCSNWLDINRVQVFINGRPSKDHNYTRRTHPTMFADDVVKFEQTIKAKLDKDAHVIVAAVGEGIKLGPVAGPRFGGQSPVAVANPIFVDVDGGGFQHNGDLLDLPIPLK